MIYKYIDNHFIKSLVCRFCDNARINDDLTDDNDFSSICVSYNDKDKTRVMISSGWGKPLRIEFEQWDNKFQVWVLKNRYYPKFCPECGREIFEFKKECENNGYRIHRACGID